MKQTTTSKKIIVVTPVFDDLESCRQLFQDLATEFPDELFVVAIDDGSLNSPLSKDLLDELPLDGVILKLKINVGHQMAIAIGLNYISKSSHPNQKIIVMDSDGEDKPSSIKSLLRCLDEPDVDAAVAERKSRMTDLRFKVFYQFYKLIFKALTGKTINFGNFMALKHSALQRLTAMSNLPIHIAATLLSSNLRIYHCPIDRGQRYAGLAKMNFISYTLHGIRALMVFSNELLIRLGIAGASIVGAILTGATIATLLKISGNASPGWFSMTLGVLGLAIIQIVAIAMMTLLSGNTVRSMTIVDSNHYFNYIEAVIEPRKGR